MNLAIDNMVKQQLLTNRITNETLIESFYSLPRADFFGGELSEVAYCDARLPLLGGQESLTPLEEATIIQALDLKGNETVLEIGTGSGYLTALLAQFAQNVITVENNEELLGLAQQKFEQKGLNNVKTVLGDAYRGWMPNGPYDVIVITGALPEIGNHFKPQLMKGGKLFAFVGETSATKATLMTLDNKDEWSTEVLFETDVAPLKSSAATEQFNF